MPFVKLDTGIVRSTLWVERDLRDVFITALLMAVPHQVETPTPQLETRGLEQTGFVVPPGWYGFVASAGIGIIHQALVNDSEGFVALDKLGKPDVESRTTAFDGRRMVRVDGGFVILNYMLYRDKDHSAADRMRRLRARKKSPVTPNSDALLRNVTQADSREQIAEADKSKSIAPKGAVAIRLPVNFAVTDEIRQWASDERLPSPDDHIGAFRDYWNAMPGAKAKKLDWPATFRNWLRRTVEYRSNGNGELSKAQQRTQRNRGAILNALREHIDNRDGNLSGERKG